MYEPATRDLINITWMACAALSTIASRARRIAESAVTVVESAFALVFAVALVTCIAGSKRRPAAVTRSAVGTLPVIIFTTLLARARLVLAYASARRVTLTLVPTVHTDIRRAVVDIFATPSG